MTLGIVMMVHTALDRAAQAANHWARNGCPVVIHVDKRVPAKALQTLRQDVSGHKNIRFCPTPHRCYWGTWSLVAASQCGSELLLKEFPEVGHVYLASGACLPLRPVAELRENLAARPDTDFIESVATREVPWTIGGLDAERFQMWFPFSWRHHRRLFDLSVRFQRRVGLRRRIPEGLTPHLGSQWWCLTRATLMKILYGPERATNDRYFRHVWIPDESYYQTLVRRYATRIESRSLTLSKFDFQGKPHIFYDDHLQLLRRSNCFVARKIWPHADRLYRSFLSEAAQTTSQAEPNPGKIDRTFAAAVERRTRGRPGLYMQSRFPHRDWENGMTAAPYSVFQGFDAVFRDFDGWLSRATEARVHGHLYAPERAEFADRQVNFAGALCDSATVRDYNPFAFLTDLIWNTRGERQCFQFGPRDRQEISWFLAADPNAQISVITGAWAVPLFQSGRDFDELRATAARLQQIEADHLVVLRRVQSRAKIRIWTMAQFVEAPMEPLQMIIDEIGPRRTQHLTEAPTLVDLTGFGAFLQKLKNDGMHPYLVN
ncbi:MAG: glycosyl transferase [Rhodobacteraceae bacterium]|nr:glycosyl transferase [Paracoccaceae bacterium]